MKHLQKISVARADAVTDFYYRIARLWSDFAYAFKYGSTSTGPY